jgi:hypothetical protein
MSVPIILRRGMDQVRLERDPMTGEVELRVWGRLSERDAFAPSVERIVLHDETLPLVIDALRQMQAQRGAA